MEAIVLVGVPASGKTSFCAERFVHTHVRLSPDVLRTRKREMELFETCLRLKQPLVIDDTNAQADQRARFLVPTVGRIMRGRSAVVTLLQGWAEERNVRSGDDGQRD